jgi:hypothetical protein
METATTHSHGLNGIDWDGESALLMSWDMDGYPDELVSEDQKIKDAEWKRKNPRTETRYTGKTAEDLDRECSEMEYNNSWYRS